MASHTPPAKPLKILMCHGFTQSGPLFHAKTRALEKSLKKAFPAGVTLIYPTGPHRITPADIPGASEPPTDEASVYGWWVRRGNPDAYICDGMDAGLETAAQALRQHGPFDGVLGFSQGGALAGMLAALLEPGRRAAFEQAGGREWPECMNGADAQNGCCHPPLRFAVIYSGLRTPNPIYRAFYEPKIRTPMLHFLGQLDTVVDEKLSLALVAACEGGADGKGGLAGSRVVWHPGGHFLPASQKEFVNALIAFIQEVVGDRNVAVRAEQVEERAEDMDMPF